MEAFINETIHLFTEASPYLVFGYLASGILSVVLERYQRINSMLTSPGQRPVWLAALIGVPMPLCSCGVLPAALALRKQGASKGTTASFLISVPETDVVSIGLTYALLGPVLAVFRPLASLATAVFTGLAINKIDSPDKSSATLDPASISEEKETTACGCCKCEEPSESENKTATPATAKKNWLYRALHFGFVEMFDDIIVQLLFGMLLAGAVVAWLPSLGWEQAVGNSFLTYLIMLVIGIPVYVCATASTPLAVGLIAGGVSPGAALVFLLAGPATNIASLVVLNSQFGRKVLATYLVSIAIISVLMGIGFDSLFGDGFRVLATSAEVHEHGGKSLIEIGSSVLLLLLAVISIYRTRLLPRLRNLRG